MPTFAGVKVVIAIDSFKGCLSSAEANCAAAEGVRDALPDAEVWQVPVSDGGEGFAHACHEALGGTWVEAEVCDPLMRPVRARYLLKGDLAVMEMAEASGLHRLKRGERNPMLTTTYGTGQLMADAVERGARHVVVGLGGSATSDAGAGMIQGLADRLSSHGRPLPHPAAPSLFLPPSHWVDMPLLRHVRFTMASDVRNPLCGPEGAARVFALQKGATPDMLPLLDERARHFAELSARLLGYDCSGCEGAGAAGGMGYAMLQYLRAECRPGTDIVLEAAGFDRLALGADLVITGEGSADRQTLMGKLPLGVLRHAGKSPVCLIAGCVRDRDALLRTGFARVEGINPPGTPLAVALRPEVALCNIRHTVRRILA